MAAVEPQVDPTTAAQVLYERHSGRLLGYFVHQLGSRDEAEDALQTTFLHAVRGLRRGVVPMAEWPWLLTIARNVCFTRWETARRRRRFETPRDPHVIEESAPAAVERAEMPLQQALAALPEQQRRAILMREWQGLSYREIADELGVTVGAVESLLFRARASLAKQLRGRRALDLGSLLAGAKSLFTGGAVALKVGLIAGVTGATALAGAATFGGDAGPVPEAPAQRMQQSTPLASVSSSPPARAPGETRAGRTTLERSPTAASAQPEAGTAPATPDGTAPTPQPTAPSAPNATPADEPAPEAPLVSTTPVTEATQPVVETVDKTVEDVGGVVGGVVEELPHLPAPPTVPSVPLPVLEAPLPGVP